MEGRTMADRIWHVATIALTDMTGHMTRHMTRNLTGQRTWQVSVSSIVITASQQLKEAKDAANKNSLKAN